MSGDFPVTKRKLLIMGAIAAIIGGCSVHGDRSADARDLMQASRDWSRVTSTGNIDAIVAYWADDATVMVPGLPTFRGKSAIRSYVEQSLKAPGFHISWEPLEAQVSKAGDLGYLIERSSLTMPDAKGNLQTQQFRVVTIWRKGPDGKWRNVVDSSISN